MQEMTTERSVAVSDRSHIEKHVHCPVVSKTVTLRGVRVSLRGGPSAVTRRSCSNIESRMEANGPVEQNKRCLLHTLS
jgi:hypothetical protein